MDDKILNARVVRNFISLLIRQEMYIGEVEKGRLTPKQSLELYRMACTSTAVSEITDLPRGQHIGCDSSGIPFEIPDDVKDKIKALSDSYYLPVQEFYDT